MKKTLSLFGLSILTLVFLMGAVSAATLAEWPLTSDGIAINVDTNINAGNLIAGSTIPSFTFNATNGVTATGWNQGSLGANDYYQVTLTASSGFNFIITSISFNQISSDPATNMSFDVNWSNDNFVTSTNIVSAGVSTITSTSSSTNTNINLNGEETFTLRIFGYNSDNSSTETFSVKNLDIQGTVTSVDPQEIQECSTIGNPGELRVKNIDFTNNGLSHATKDFGSDDEWFPFEEIEVEIDIKNDGDYDIDDIEVSWGLYDIDAGEWVIDFDEEDEFNIKDGDTETFTVSFKLDDDLDVDLEDLSDDTDNYRLYVVAEGTIDDNDSPDDGKDTCAFDYESASMIIENDFVILDNIQIPETVMCGETVQITADVWNIGDDDQDEVSVFVSNKDLDLRKDIMIGDIDAFDSEPMDLTFKIPEDAEEKRHLIKLTVYDEDNDIYENDYDDDQSVFSVFLKVEGNCKVAEEITISASLESEAKAGKEMVVGVLLTNTADTTRSFTLEASGYEMWAELSELPGLLTLNADSAGEVLLKLDIKKGISGEQTFLILVYSDNKLITTQPVSVNVESAKPFLGITGLVTTDNAYLWGIGLLNIILIVIIILVAVRIARRK